MRILDKVLSKWFVPKEQYEGVQALAQTYLEQVEDCERSIASYRKTLDAIADKLGMSGSPSFLDMPARIEVMQRDLLGKEERWRGLERDLAREIEANSLFTRKIQSIGRFLLDEEIPLSSVRTDEFYDRIDSQSRILHRIELESRILRADNQQYCLNLRKIGAIALQDGDFEISLESITEEDIDRILRAIAVLRGRISDLEAEKESLIRGEIADLKEESSNCIESLKLSQQEVVDLQEQLEDVRTRVKDHIEELTKLRRDRIVLISKSSTIANRVREEMDLLTDSYIPLD